MGLPYRCLLQLLHRKLNMFQKTMKLPQWLSNGPAHRMRCAGHVMLYPFVAIRTSYVVSAFFASGQVYSHLACPGGFHTAWLLCVRIQVVVLPWCPSMITLKDGAVVVNRT